MQRVSLVNEDMDHRFAEFEEPSRTFKENQKEYGRCISKMYREGHTCDDLQVVTCGKCKTSWCETHDPSPASQCHVCNGRGYSVANTADRQVGHVFVRKLPYDSSNTISVVSEDSEDSYLQHAWIEQID